MQRKKSFRSLFHMPVFALSTSETANLDAVQKGMAAELKVMNCVFLRAAR